VSEVVLVWRSDAHNSDQPPQSRTDDWNKTILGKLVQVGEVAREVEADGVLDGGDNFHIKSPTRNSHRMSNDVAHAHREYPCPVYATVGNHDVKYGEIGYLGESPLGTLFETGCYQRLYDEHEAVFEKGGIKVRVVGIPFHGVKYDMNRFTTIVKGDEDWLVAVVHCLASPKGGEMFAGEDILKYADLANMAPDVFAFGHWHKNQGIQTVGGKHFVNIGSLSRGALIQDDLERIPACAILRFTKTDFTADERPLKVQDAMEVFDVEGRVRAEGRTLSVEAFMDSLEDTLVTTETTSLLEEIRASDTPEKVKERAIHYLERAGAT